MNLYRAIVKHNCGMNSNTAFASWFRQTLTKRGMSQRGFAEAAGIAPSTVGAWWRGERRPDPESCDKIADYLVVDRDFILDLAGHRPDEPDLPPDDLRARIIERVKRVDMGNPGNQITLLGIEQALKENIR